MATVNKKGNASRDSGNKKVAAKNSPARSVPAKSAKTTAPQKVAAKKNPAPSKAAKSAVKNPAKPSVTKADAKKNVAKKKSSKPAQSQKKHAANNIWDLVEAKKRNASKTPAWQTIAHHDHPTPRGGKEHGADQSSATSTHIEMPGHRDRGTG